MWKPCPDAQRVVDAISLDLETRSPWLAAFAAKLLAQTGERWMRRVDRLWVPANRYGERLERARFTVAGAGLAVHEQAYVPRIELTAADRFGVCLRVDGVEAFTRRGGATGTGAGIEGVRGGPFRRARMDESEGVEVWGAERWGSLAWELDDRTPEERRAAERHLDGFRSRGRDEGADSVDALFSALEARIDLAITEIGQAWTTALFFRAEREHWVQHTAAAQVQAARHDALGLGWGHHDHHTYRSSRAYFAPLIGVLERLGLKPREAFHAGPEAGWGAQVMEHPTLPFVVFADVDMSPDELEGDFAHTPLTPGDTLGTVGLWCGLHGEALFGAGLHHLACHFDFDAARAQLPALGVQVMTPFSDLPELRQAFTVAERQPIRKARLDRLQAARLITAEQADAFASDGALGSHLELIERKQAYRGFHQRGISAIIEETDPRNA